MQVKIWISKNIIVVDEGASLRDAIKIQKGNGQVRVNVSPHL